MRVTVLTPYAISTRLVYEPLTRLGHDLHVIGYDALTEMRVLPTLVKNSRPDWVLYIGALERYRGRPVPDVDVLAEIGNAHVRSRLFRRRRDRCGGLSGALSRDRLLRSPGQHRRGQDRTDRRGGNDVADADRRLGVSVDTSSVA